MMKLPLLLFYALSTTFVMLQTPMFLSPYCNLQFSSRIATNPYVPLALLKTSLCLSQYYNLHCLATNTCTLTLPCHFITIFLLLTSIILLLSLGSPIAIYDPSVWVPQRSSPSSSLVLLTTTQCHPTSSLEVHDHSWNNHHPC